MPVDRAAELCLDGIQLTTLPESLGRLTGLQTFPTTNRLQDHCPAESLGS